MTPTLIRLLSLTICDEANPQHYLSDPYGLLVLDSKSSGSSYGSRDRFETARTKSYIPLWQIIETSIPKCLDVVKSEMRDIVSSFVTNPACWIRRTSSCICSTKAAEESRHRGSKGRHGSVFQCHNYLDISLHIDIYSDFIPMVPGPTCMFNRLAQHLRRVRQA
jgi:hypothetical protein